MGSTGEPGRGLTSTVTARPLVGMSAPGRDLTMAELSRLAAAFDALDDAEGGRRWPAARFVEYVRDELAARGQRIQPAGRPPDNVPLTDEDSNGKG